MANFDAFNGDADGICALVQLRLAEPRNAELITGVKRDIKLLSRVTAKSGDKVTALDISMDKNKGPLIEILNSGADVLYIDHHFAGDIPQNDRLNSVINTAPDTCTSLLVNQLLRGQFAHWAVVAAYGDNMLKAADMLANELGCSEAQKEKLKALGIAINYNAYGADLTDLHIEPVELYKLLVEFENPLQLTDGNHEIYQQLVGNYQADMQQVESAEVVYQTETGKVFVLPNEAWARRISGVLGNDLANQSPNKAHAVLTKLAQGGYLVSVRAPKTNAVGADDLCRQFETGGGRKAAAGINVLPEQDLNKFTAAFETQFASN